MSRTIKLLVCAAIVAGWATAALAAGDSLSEQKKAQSKLLAQRAARVDAMRKIAERIKGLRITSDTTVRDFVAESDNIQTAMDAWISGMREIGKPKYMEDGTCEVTLEVTLQDIIVNLTEIHNRYAKGDKFKAEDFTKMTVTNGDIHIIRETGNGAAPAALVENTGVAIKTGETAASIDMPADAKAFWMAHVTGQGRLMAIRAAHVDALRKLAERIKGLNITSETTVKDFVAESDVINTYMDTWLKGAKETAIYYHPDELIVEVTMQVKLRTIYETLKSYAETHIKGDVVKMKEIEEYTQRSEDKVISETGSGVPPEKYLKDVTVEMKAALELKNNWPPAIRAVGNAAIDEKMENKGQAKLMAFRAAELDARRKLAEQVDGLEITSNTTVKDFVAQNDEIQTSLDTFQLGGHVVEGSQRVMEDGTVQVTVEIDLKPLWDMVIFYQHKLNITIK